MNPRSLLPEVRLHRPGADALTVLCIVLLVVGVGQVLVGWLGGDAGLLRMFEWFGLSREGLKEGRVWQLGTHPLLHGTWLHFLINGLVVYLIGGRIHHIMGGRGLVKIFVGGVLLASAFHLVFHPARPIGAVGEVGSGPLVGASGGAMALLIALTSMSPDSRMWPVPVSGKNLGRGLLLAALLLYLITPGLGVPGLRMVGDRLLAAGLEGLFQVAHIYHFGGGLFGLLYVRRLLREPVTLEELRRKRAKREGLAA